MNSIVLLLCLAASSDEKIVVGVHEFAPMVKKAGERHRGFDIDLWEAVAKEIGVESEYRELTFDELLAETANPDSDVQAALAGITISEEREADVDFSHAYFNSSLKIAIHPRHDDRWQLFRFRHASALWDSIWQPAVLEVGLLLVGFLVVAAHVVYFFERGTGGESGTIDDRYYVGIWQALYFCNVTSSTVGYGDFVARKIAGRIFVILLIYSGIVFFANFTALLSADYTTERIESHIADHHDLRDRPVATKANTYAADALEALGARVYKVEKIEDAFALLAEGKVDAVVFDAPVIDHWATTHDDVLVLEDEFEKQHYGIALKPGSPLREPINRALLKLKEDGVYDEIHARWFGAD